LCALITVATVGVLRAEEPSAPSLTTLGLLAYEESLDIFGDGIVPLLGEPDDWVLFFNPRFSGTDQNEQEFNLGIGYRRLCSDGRLLLGGNTYYDVRKSEHDNTFHQFGFGVEALSEWVDARANYYLADEEEHAIAGYAQTDTTASRILAWGDMSAYGYTIMQQATVEMNTTTRHFRQYEVSVSGWDAEVGVKLPYVDEWVETRVFAGYQRFENPWGDDLKGWKARLEVRALPGLTLDAGYFTEEELVDSKFYAGFRVQLPFDLSLLADGRSPFDGAGDAFHRRAAAPVSARMNEMVVRDMRVNDAVSGFREVESMRETGTVIGSAQVLLSDSVVFVDGDNNTGAENGTYQHPYRNVSNGVANAFGDRIVFIDDAAQPYVENIAAPSGTELYGLLSGNDGYVMGDVRPTIRGANVNEPTITLYGSGVIAGLEVASERSLAINVIQPVVVEIRDVISPQGYGVHIESEGTPGLDVTVVDCEIHGYGGWIDGNAAVSIHGSQLEGDVSLRIEDNFLTRSARGIQVVLRGDANVDVALSGNTLLSNRTVYASSAFGSYQEGIGIELDVVARHIIALLEENDCEGSVDGIHATLVAPDVQASILRNRCVGNVGSYHGWSWGFSESEGDRGSGITLTASAWTMAASLIGNTCNDNGGRGLVVDLVGGDVAASPDVDLHDNVCSGNRGYRGWRDRYTPSPWQYSETGIGMYVSVNAIGPFDIEGTGNTVIGNARCGVFLVDSGAGGTAGSVAFTGNEIWGHPSAGDVTIVDGDPTFEMFSTLPVTVDARDNWWGTASPSAGEFSGNILYDPWRTSP
jgi:hypothetical protein